MPEANQFTHSPRTTRKRTEPEFIEPMQCKPVTIQSAYLHGGQEVADTLWPSILRIAKTETLFEI